VDSDNESRIEKCIEQLLYADENLHDNSVNCEVDITSEPRIATSEDVDLLMASFVDLESKWKSSNLVAAASFDNEGAVDNEYVSEVDNEVEGLYCGPGDDASYTTAPFVEGGMIPFDELHQDKTTNASSRPPKGIARQLSVGTKSTNMIDSNEAQDDKVDEKDTMETTICVDIDIETTVGTDADDKSPRFPISQTEIQLEDHNNGNSNATMYTAQWSISIEHDLQTLRLIGSLHTV